MNEELTEKLTTNLEQMFSPETENAMASAMDDLRRYITEMAPSQISLLLRVMTDKLLTIDASQMIRQFPEISESFMELFWRGMVKLSENSVEMQSLLKKTRDVNVNIEASDSPFRGHFTVSKNKLSGGSAFFHFKDEDYRIMATTKVILQLLTGQLYMGFSNPELQTAGHSGFATFVTPIVRVVASLIKGQIQKG